MKLYKQELDQPDELLTNEQRQEKKRLQAIKSKKANRKGKPDLLQVLRLIKCGQVRI